MQQLFNLHLLLIWYCVHYCTWIAANPEAKRLYDDLLTNYNRLIRPVGNNTDRLTVKLGLRLSQLIEVNLKNQIMTTSVWVDQEWTDYKLKWNPEDYGGVDYLHVPSEHIWLPDIVLYNNADGNYEVTIMTKAIIHHTGKVIWKPPAIYKSFCEIDLEYFPFDEQTCILKFGSWSYDGYKVNLQHMSQIANSDTVDMGIDLHDFYLSVEWDVMKVPAVRHEKFYICCEEPYLDIIFNLTLRRKTLFYTVNLIIPCIGLSFLSVLVFYLPSDSGEKVSLCISVLVSLTVFFLLLAEIIPPTSLTVPLLGKYLLFTMVLVTLSVVVTIAVLNVNFRSPVTHRMKPWVFNFFTLVLPKLLFIQRPKKDPAAECDDEFDGKLNYEYNTQNKLYFSEIGHIDYIEYNKDTRSLPHATDCKTENFSLANIQDSVQSSLSSSSSSSADSTSINESELLSQQMNQNWNGVTKGEVPNSNNVIDTYYGSSAYHLKQTHPMEKTIEDAKFVAQHVRNKDKFENVIEDWKYIAMVLDRLFLWIFTVACILGTILIILQAPSLYDTTEPIDMIQSKMAHKRRFMRMLPTMQIT